MSVVLLVMRSIVSVWALHSLHLFCCRCIVFHNEIFVISTDYLVPYCKCESLCFGVDKTFIKCVLCLSPHFILRDTVFSMWHVKENLLSKSIFDLWIPFQNIITEFVGISDMLLRGCGFVSRNRGLQVQQWVGLTYGWITLVSHLRGRFSYHAQVCDLIGVII